MENEQLHLPYLGANVRTMPNPPLYNIGVVTKDLSVSRQPGQIGIA